MATRIATSPDVAMLPRVGMIDRLNGVWHKPALLTFTAIVLAHWAEHLTQAFQIYVLKWPIPKALGFLGLFYPWLVKSEVLHYLYALVMLVGIWVFRKGFKGRARMWWTMPGSISRAWSSNRCAAGNGPDSHINQLTL